MRIIYTIPYQDKLHVTGMTQVKQLSCRPPVLFQCLVKIYIYCTFTGWAAIWNKHSLMLVKLLIFNLHVT